MKILVTNPTGKIGSRIVPELLAPEFSVRVIVRDPARLPEEIRDQVEVISGSADDVAALRRALMGVDALFWCVPPESVQEKNVDQHYERFACGAWQAIREALTARVVTISALGSDAVSKAGRISGLHAMEDILNESGAAIRHLRCGWLMDNLLAEAQIIREQGLVSYPVAADIPIPMSVASDVADTALRWLVRRDWDGIEAFAVPAAESLSFDQATAAIQRVLKRPVQYRQASANEYLHRLVATGASFEYARSQIEMFAALAQAGTPGIKGGVQSAIKTLAAWTESELMPAIESLDELSHGALIPHAGSDPWNCANRLQVCGTLRSTDPQLVDVNRVKKLKPIKWSSSTWSISLR